MAGLGRATSILVAAALLMTASGCRTAGDQRSHAEPSSFSGAGPWGAEFAELSTGASEYEARILADGVITSEELADAQAKNRACMADAGYIYQDFDDGTSEILPEKGELGNTDEVFQVKQGCSHRYDTSVTYLFNEVRRNPEKQDEAKITVRCLRKSGLVGGNYSERKWRTENDTGRFSFDDYDPAAVQCRLDPLSLWRDG